MATGDAQDFSRRISALLPPWFPDPLDAPVVYGLIFGISTALSQCYGLISYVRNQTRLSTSTDAWLDLFAADFFGTLLSRRVSESDSPYRNRISANLFLEKATRKGMVQALTKLTGNTPTIFEPARPQDSFVLGYSGLGTGQLGSYAMNNQAFITVHRSLDMGGALVAGLGSTYTGLGSSYLAMEDADSLYGAAQNADIYSTIEATKPLASTMWTRIAT